MRRIAGALTVSLVLFLLALPAPAQSGERDAGEREAFISGTLVVKGEGSAPGGVVMSTGQKRIMALRAAKVSALREATEIINGVSVIGETTVLNASVRSDDVRTVVEGVVKGSRVVKEDYDPLSETAVVHVAVPLSGPDGLIARLLPGVGEILPGGPYFEPEKALAGEFDGLIVDCRGIDLRPAVVNRVVTRGGEVIYDPVKVKKDVLQERGGAVYTDTVQKAITLLAGMGSSSPLTVVAAGVRNSTDAVIGLEDAKKVFSSNLEKNFLQEARVVFVLR